MPRLRPINVGLAIALVVLPAIAGGCGEDTEQVSAEQLVARGDAICAEGRARFADIQAEPPSNASERTDQVGDLVDAATDELNDLRNLRPPEELKESYESYLQARGSALELLEEGQDAADDGDGEGYLEAVAKATADQPARLKLAQAVGFKTCSKP